MNNIINAVIDTLDKENPDWNVIMLATANKVISPKHKNNAHELEISAPDGTINPVINIEKLTSATTSSAYIVKDTYVDAILELFNTCNNNMKQEKLSGNNFENWALDQKWASLQKKDHWYAISPDPIKQRDIWSTILTESHK
jgi:hypothetical protein